MRTMITAMVVATIGFIVAAPGPVADSPTEFSFPAGDRVLDGDTLLVRGVPIKIAGVDAPELGPWARCWAEAALAGHAKEYVERELSGGRWRLSAVPDADAHTIRTARLTRADGEDLADLLQVYGYAAATNTRWNWCGENANLHDPSAKEPVPHGPNLWWPAGQMFDARAGD